MEVKLLNQIAASKPAILWNPQTAIPAGFPSPAQEYQSSSIDLNQVLIKDKTSTYLFRVTGSSMVDAGIADGDEIIVDRSLNPKTGDVIVASLDGEFTVKRFHIDSAGKGWLLPENPDFAPLPISELSDFSIFGVVTTCIHHVR